MRETFVVMRRELVSYFVSPIAYVVGVLFLGFHLYFATARTIVAGARASMGGFFEILPYPLIVLCSVLTMRLWAEERKLGTLELLMTFPITVRQLVLAKFGAAVAFLGLLLLFAFGLPLTLGAYGRLDWPPVLGSYLASLFFAGSFVAVGMFWSSVTREQIIAALMTLATLSVLFLLGWPEAIEYANEWMPSWMVDVISSASPYRYFFSLALGVLDSSHFVYFACFCAFFLHANTVVLQAQRQ